MGQSRSSQFDTGGVPFPVFYTAKSVNATNSSRTAINADLQVGHVLCVDPYSWDGADSSAGAKPVNATQPATATLMFKKLLVVDVPAGVNDRISGNQRRGGIVWVVDRADDVLAMVDGTTDVTLGGALEVTNGSFNLTLDSTAALSTGFCGYALEAYTTDAPALRRVFFGNQLG